MTEKRNPKKSGCCGVLQRKKDKNAMGKREVTAKVRQQYDAVTDE